MRCFFGWHHWGYFSVKTNLGSGNVVRICGRCKDFQCWMNWSEAWSLTFDPEDSLAEEVFRQAKITAPYSPVDISGKVSI